MTYHIESLDRHRDWIPTLAASHVDYWGSLTGFDSAAGYVDALERWSVGADIPTSSSPGTKAACWVGESAALGAAESAGSHAWLAQLFVHPGHRRGVLGAALVTAAIAHAGRCGFGALYLYASGTLLQYYARLGWIELERVEYLGKERTVMRYDIAGARDQPSGARRRACRHARRRR